MENETKAKCCGIKIFPPKGERFEFADVPFVLVNSLHSDKHGDFMPIHIAIGEYDGKVDVAYVCSIVIEKSPLGNFDESMLYLYDYKTRERANEVRDDIIKTYETAEKNREILAHYVLPEE